MSHLNGTHGWRTRHGGLDAYRLHACWVGDSWTLPPKHDFVVTGTLSQLVDGSGQRCIWLGFLFGAPWTGPSDPCRLPPRRRTGLRKLGSSEEKAIGHDGEEGHALKEVLDATGGRDWSVGGTGAN